MLDSLPKQRLNPKRPFRLRLLASAAAAVAIASATYHSGYYSLRVRYNSLGSHPMLVYGQEKAIRELELLRQELAEYRRVNGKFPESLVDLDRNALDHIHFDEFKQAVDPWGRLYQYYVNSDGFTLFSFGRDGKLGGVGLDVDLYGDEARGGIESMCLMAGICGFAICFFGSTKTSDFSDILLRFLITLFGSIVTAFMISAAHLFHGH
jgi:hypothetical protein